MTKSEWCDMFDAACDAMDRVRSEAVLEETLRRELIEAQRQAWSRNAIDVKPERVEYD